MATRPEFQPSPAPQQAGLLSDIPQFWGETADDLRNLARRAGRAWDARKEADRLEQERWRKAHDADQMRQYQGPPVPMSAASLANDPSYRPVPPMSAEDAIQTAMMLATRGGALPSGAKGSGIVQMRRARGPNGEVIHVPTDRLEGTDAYGRFPASGSGTVWESGKLTDNPLAEQVASLDRSRFPSATAQNVPSPRLPQDPSLRTQPFEPTSPPPANPAAARYAAKYGMEGPKDLTGPGVLQREYPMVEHPGSPPPLPVRESRAGYQMPAQVGPDFVGPPVEALRGFASSAPKMGVDEAISALRGGRAPMDTPNLDLLTETAGRAARPVAEWVKANPKKSLAAGALGGAYAAGMRGAGRPAQQAQVQQQPVQDEGPQGLAERLQSGNLTREDEDWILAHPAAQGAQ